MKLDKPLEEYDKDLVHYMLNGLDEFETKQSNSTDLISTNDKMAYQIKDSLESKRNKIAILERMLERKKDKFNAVLRNLNDQVKSVMRVIGIIELYLGIDEEIIQILEGEKAPIDTPFSFRQLVLHMDEEVATTKDQGLDFQQIDKFDKWVRKNYKKIMPEEKGVVVARPRRDKKQYSDNPLVDSLMNEQNFSTYVLIRNGTNIYRIATSQNIYPHLFPSHKEMERLNKIASGEIRESFFDEEKAENELLRYKRNVLMLQGLLDRTDILHPKPQDLNLLNPESYGDHVNFIYDGDGITDGRESYFDWLKRINSELELGDRFYFCGFCYSEKKDNRMAQVGWMSYRDDDGIPYDQHPDKKVYNIERVEPSERTYDPDGTERLVFKHNPEDTIYHPDFSSSVRKKALTYFVYRDDDCIINYEKVTVEDVDYYLNDRVNRQHYLKMMPILKGIKKQLLEELRWEKEFKKLLKSQLDFDVTEEAMNEAIEWWKNKVIQKRPLKKEDAKALRMIKKRVISQNK
jgi:hypothetical protein